MPLLAAEDGGTWAEGRWPLETVLLIPLSVENCSLASWPSVLQEIIRLIARCLASLYIGLNKMRYSSEFCLFHSHIEKLTPPPHGIHHGQLLPYTRCLLCSSPPCPPFLPHWYLPLSFHYWLLLLCPTCESLSQGKIPPRGCLDRSGTFLVWLAHLGVDVVRRLLASYGWRPGMVPTILQCTGTTPPPMHSQPK